MCACVRICIYFNKGITCIKVSLNVNCVKVIEKRNKLKRKCLSLQAVKLNILIFSSDIRENGRRFLKEFFEIIDIQVAWFAMGGGAETT